ncbi:hypothetical protein BGX38DRAFT_1268796 [Terfezia claveryi]|nr:hypothetical protein BGX38DRAFT_1268796 [Terfezia claveryi]
MSNKQQLTDSDLAILAGNSPAIESPSTCHAGRKRKGPSLSDTPSKGVDNSPSQSSRYRPLAKRPTPIGQPSSSSFRGKPTDHKTSGSTGFSLVTCPWHSHLERITSLAVAISRISRTVKSAFIQQLYDMEPLLQKLENLQQSYLELRECSQQSIPALVTCTWRSHLERINSLAVAISQISRDFRSATIQPLLEVDVEGLLQQSEYLQQSYFKLQEFVQSSVPSSGGSTLGMSELGRNYDLTALWALG